MAELKALVASIPDLDGYSSKSRVHLEWLARAHALVAEHDRFAAIPLQTATDFLQNPLMRSTNAAMIINTVHRTIAALDIEVGGQAGGAFGPGAVYDLLRGLRGLIASAYSEVFIIDPYMNAEIFDAYVSAASDKASIRLMLRDHDGSLKPALDAFVAQKARVVEARDSTVLHDRVVFIDKRSAWVLGQSIKDAARVKATYLAPLPPDVAALKLSHYEAVWTAAKPLK